MLHRENNHSIFLSDIRLDENKIPCLCTETKKPIQTAKLTTPDAVISLAEELYPISTYAEERGFLFVTNGDVATHAFTLSTGSINLSVMEPRDIMLRMLLTHAVEAFLLHNHPSGCTEPSETDITTTRRIVEAGKLMNLPVKDHIILSGKGTGYSLREHNNKHHIWNA